MVRLNLLYQDESGLRVEGFHSIDPAVFLPWFSCDTRRTAMRRAASDFIKRLECVDCPLIATLTGSENALLDAETCRSTCARDVFPSLARPFGLAFPPVLSSLAYDSCLLLRENRAYVSLSWRYPERSLFKQSCHQGRYGLDAYSQYRPPARLPLMVTPFLLSVLRCFRLHTIRPLTCRVVTNPLRRVCPVQPSLLGKPVVPRRLGFLEDGSDVCSIYPPGWMGFSP